MLGFALTLVLPETSGVGLEDIATPSGISLNETAIGTKQPSTRVLRTPHRCWRPIRHPCRCRWPIRHQRSESHFLDVDPRDRATQDAACALISVIEGAIAAVSSRNATARPKISPIVWPDS